MGELVRRTYVVTATEMRKRVDSKLVIGDALTPGRTDLIAQTVTLPYDALPRGDNWHMLTGNMHTNLWARIGYRFEVEFKSK